MRSVKYVLFWLGFIVLITLFDVTKDDVANRKYFKFFPNSITQNTSVNYGDGVGVEFRRAKDGHFYIEAMVHGIPVNFLVDTGATDIVLSVKDAKRLKHHLKYLNRKKTYHTANGTVKALYVEISEMQVGKFIVNNVKASVNVSPMRTSLLGMSFLQYFHFNMSGDKLTLNSY
ncbi:MULTISPECIES: retropepsin-like aspartic protease family protein [Ehrlichia]|uniref:Clan AA aspartic protease, TIGR02281 family protein n=1 Tax=Ehrlichia cf. muris str. EmCRT TaxID=1359167 RepID=A0A0F3NEQ9_9RICK|nr:MULTISPECIES: TIGR02281 family clan AA aspartic protease [Ehrlichia]KJV65409.1 clan AA aspartic protease, TIGR02281 family protein [Ehrlichia cf. muris str. EmCRT]OUC04643.1 aspartyl protease [Ehrlichia sp. Wisconsin_h]